MSAPVVCFSGRAASGAPVRVSPRRYPTPKPPRRLNTRVVKEARDKCVPWRPDDFGADWVFEDVVEALTLYGELEGNFDENEEDGFVVPAPIEESLRLSPFELAAMDGDAEPDMTDGPWDEDGEEDGGRGGTTHMP